MIHVEVMYLIDGTVYSDEAVSTKMATRVQGDSRVAIIRTANQSATYVAPQRIVVTHGVDAPEKPFTRNNAPLPPEGS